MTRAVLAPLAAAVVGALTFTACGGGGSSATVPADANVVVDAVDSLQFDKTAYDATAGTVKIAYVNKGSINHTLLVVSADRKQVGVKLSLSGGAITSGTYTLAAGQYLLFCDVPGHSNMKATLTVK